MFNKIKNNLSAILYILCIPIFLVLILKDTIKHHFSKQSDTDTKESFIKSLAENGGNTHYKMKCKKCGYNKKIMIGGGHNAGFTGTFYSELVYCSDCKEPLVKSSMHYRNLSDGENKIINDTCPKCNKKTIPYDIENNKIKLKCPECSNDDLEITNLYEYWMT